MTRTVADGSVSPAVCTYHVHAIMVKAAIESLRTGRGDRVMEPLMNGTRAHSYRPRQSGKLSAASGVLLTLVWPVPSRFIT